MTDEPVRAFVAVDLPGSVKSALGDLIARLQRGAPSEVKWVDPSVLHLTLKFLGEIPATQVADVVGAMALACRGHGPILLRVQGLGAFPTLKSPRVLWVGLTGDLGRLQALQQSLEEALAARGFPREERPFSPHLTLGRLREGASPAVRQQVGETLARASLPQGLEVPVPDLVLYRSVLRPQGPLYTPLHRQALGP